MNAQCKTGKGMGAMRMADGGTVAPYSIRGLHRRAVEGATDLMEKVVPIQSATARYNAAHPTPATPAPVAPAPTPTAPSNALSDYASGQADVLKRREREAGMKDGGALRTGKGGAVRGKGKGDKIPAKYEPGEFVVSNAMRRNAPGLIKQLHALRNHTLAKEGKTPAQADAGRFKGGAIRALNGLDPVEEERRARLVAQIPTGGEPQVQGGQPVNSTELGRNVSNTLSAIAPIAPVLTGARALANASTLAPKVGGVISNLASRVAPVMPYAVPAAGAAALQAASSPAANATAGQPSAAAPATPAPAVPGQIASVQPTAQSADQRFGKFAPATLQDAGPVDEAQRVAGGRAVGAQDRMLADQLAADNARVTGFSATIGDPAEQQRARDKWSAESTLSSITATPAQKAVAAQTLQSLNSRELAAETNAGTTQRAGMTDATTRRAQDINAASQGAISKLAREKFALESTGVNLDNAAKKRVADAQSKLIDPNATEPERVNARETLRALLGKDKEVPNRFTAVPGGQEVDPATGMLVTRPAMVLNNQTGEFVTPNQPGKTPPPVGTVKGGFRFKGGNPADQKSWEKV